MKDKNSFSQSPSFKMYNCRSEFNPYSSYFSRAPSSRFTPKITQSSLFEQPIDPPQPYHETDFMERTRQKHHHLTIARLVKCAEHELQHDLNTRRNRLAEMLRREDELYHEEVQLKQRMDIETRMREREQEMFARRKAKEHEREEFVAAKKLQQMMYACHDIRPHLRQKLLEDSKMCQLMQIEEKRKMEMVEEDHDNLWMTVANRRNQQQLEREEEEKRLRLCQKICMKQTLQDQMKSKLVREDELKYYEREERLKRDALQPSPLEEQRLRLERFESMKKLDDDRREHQKMLEMARQMRERNDLEFMKLINEKVGRELEEEKLKKREEVMARKRETEIFLNYVRDHKSCKKMTEEEHEKEVREMAQNLERKWCKNREVYDKRREELTKSTIATLRQQISERAAKRIDEQKQRFLQSLAVEREMHKNREEDKQELENRKTGQSTYATALRTQVEIMRQKKEEDRLRELELERIVKAEQERCDKLVKDYFEKNIDILPPHPNNHLMKIL